ncbi:hypothetical protein KM043_000928 [Ampulex compressa]|nr:hypothetical protein KM043_000928 [Ampulex compressa]
MRGDARRREGDEAERRIGRVGRSDLRGPWRCDADELSRCSVGRKLVATSRGDHLDVYNIAIANRSVQRFSRKSSPRGVRGSPPVNFAALVGSLFLAASPLDLAERPSSKPASLPILFPRILLAISQEGAGPSEEPLPESGIFSKGPEWPRMASSGPFEGRRRRFGLEGTTEVRRTVEGWRSSRKCSVSGARECGPTYFLFFPRVGQRSAESDTEPFFARSGGPPGLAGSRPRPSGLVLSYSRYVLFGLSLTGRRLSVETQNLLHITYGPERSSDAPTDTLARFAESRLGRLAEAGGGGCRVRGVGGSEG